MSPAPLLLAAWLAVPAAAQEAPPAAAVETHDPEILEVKRRISEEPVFADMVAQRIARSKLSDMIASDGGDRSAQVKEWVAKDPESAARVALGLARDDAQGNTVFEDELLHQMRLTAVDNTKDNRGVLGGLRDAARKSKLLSAQGQEMSEDEKREILRTLFEGQGGQSDRVLGMKEAGGKAASGARPAVGEAPPETAFSGYYDRLSQANLHGYSPQLLAMQSALNQRRPPGAPALIETGKLDYPTLVYPAYGMDYDVGGLESRLRRDRLLSLSRLAGVALTARDLSDPGLEARLAAKVPPDKLLPRFKRRAELAARARSAAAAFRAAAAASKDPRAITRQLLVELGRRQREAARWIAAAALEEELARLDSLDGFLTPELLAAVDAAPAPAPMRGAYKTRGQGLQSRLAQARAGAQKAEDLLSSDSWQGAVAQVDRLNADERALRRALEREVPVYARVPLRLSESGAPQARWRQWLDDLAVRWLPGSAYGRAVAERRANLARYLAAFGQIADGDLDGAAAAVAAFEPGGR